ncbi:hypothetical protein [Aeromicrobium sp. Root495]|uniref:hypothetical protein n=1 Tax=Aeromicrobium sp. Root495 TaxID=1736550 RepID=UPI000A960447|nr:hypothetical protein [Aeromicrobium sp. Root495]
MRIALLGAAAVTAVGAVLGALLEGRDGLLGALVGGVVVVAFLGSTPLLLTPAVEASTMLSPASALGFFFLKAVAVVGLLVVLFDVGGAAGQVDRRTLGLTAIAVSLVWTAAQVVAFRKDRTPIYDLGNKP